MLTNFMSIVSVEYEHAVFCNHKPISEFQSEYICMYVFAQT